MGSGAFREVEWLAIYPFDRALASERAARSIGHVAENKGFLAEWPEL
jgi:hypothetical protein